MRLLSKTHPQFILAAGDDGVFFVAHGIKDPAPPFFASSQNKKAETVIRDALVQHPRVPLTVYADTLALDIRVETLPNLNIFDRVKLARRRLQQTFPQGRLAAILKQSRHKILLAGLHENSPVSLWLERLKSCNPSVALLPVECAGIAPRLVPEAPQDWILLYCRLRTGGFRQIVTHKGEIVFTRVTPNLPPNASADDVAGIAARDIRASLGYLARSGLEDSRNLRVLGLMPEKFHAAFMRVNAPVHSMRMLSPSEAAEQLDLPFMADVEDSYSDLLFAGWFTQQRKPRLTLGSPTITETRQTETIRHYGMRAGLAALALSVLLIGWQASGLFAAMYDNHQQAAQLEALQHKLTQEQATAAPITEPLGRLRIAIERQRIFAAPVSMPWAMLQNIAHGLGDEARFVKLDWSNDAKSTDGILHADVKLVQNPPLSSADREVTVARFQKLARNVSLALPGFDVRVTRYPFPALPQEALTNAEAEQDRHEGATAELSVRRLSP